jgi:hypothetical protein
VRIRLTKEVGNLRSILDEKRSQAQELLSAAEQALNAPEGDEFGPGREGNIIHWGNIIDWGNRTITMGRYMVWYYYYGISTSYFYCISAP